MKVSNSISIVILTYNRPSELLKTISAFDKDVFNSCEIIVVDNASEKSAEKTLRDYPLVKVLTMEENVGVGARNKGIEAASGKIVITLDDDVRGISMGDLSYIESAFSKNSHLSAINFKVLEEGSDRQINWCHHRKIEQWSNKSFETYEISEGAVAFKKAAVEEVGYYPENYFISHEGPDLALRLMNVGGQVIYDPSVQVFHARSPIARASWRRYYFDTRNLIWLVYKYYSFRKGFKKIFIGLSALFIYALKDGYIKYWFKAVYDALLGLRSNTKQKISDDTWANVERLESFNPSFIYMVKKRLTSSSVDI